jgi:hypothetical protein
MTVEKVVRLLNKGLDEWYSKNDIKNPGILTVIRNQERLGLGALRRYSIRLEYVFNNGLIQHIITAQKECRMDTLTEQKTCIEIVEDEFMVSLLEFVTKEEVYKNLNDYIESKWSLMNTNPV